MMEQTEVFEKVVDIIRPYAKNQVALESVGMTTSILDELKVNSARLVDIILAIEDEFDIEVEDEDADEARTIGATIDIIMSKLN